MARTKSYFERRVSRLARMLEFHDEWHVELHCYAPDDRNLYQIHIVDKDGGVHISLPEHRSMLSAEFEEYLNGMLDSTKLEGMWRGD